MSHRFRLAQSLASLASDSRGAVVSAELLVLSTIILIGMIAAAVTARDAVICELSDVVGCIQDKNQTFNFNGIVSASSTIAGSGFSDRFDVVDNPEDKVGSADNCILFDLAPSNEGGASNFSPLATTDSDDPIPNGNDDNVTSSGDADSIDEDSANQGN